jgi:GNAT superfamily N-acetyltransferase
MSATARSLKDGGATDPLLKFRRAQVDDAATLTAIALAGKQYWGYPAEWMTLWRPDLTITPQYIRFEAVQIAEKLGETVGFVGLSTGGNGRHLEHLWLWPDYIGRGYGRALFNEAVRIARQEGETELWINSDPNAEPFYLKMGAARIGQEIYELPGAVRREVPLLVYRVG